MDPLIRANADRGGTKSPAAGELSHTRNASSGRKPSSSAGRGPLRRSPDSPVSPPHGRTRPGWRVGVLLRRRRHPEPSVEDEQQHACSTPGPPQLVSAKATPDCAVRRVSCPKRRQGSPKLRVPDNTAPDDFPRDMASIRLYNCLIRAQALRYRKLRIGRLLDGLERDTICQLDQRQAAALPVNVKDAEVGDDP